MERVSAENLQGAKSSNYVYIVFSKQRKSEIIETQVSKERFNNVVATNLQKYSSRYTRCFYFLFEV